MIPAPAITLIQLVACIGYGAALLGLLGINARLSPSERLTFGFALGSGVLGWMLFFFGVSGLLATPYLVGILAVGAVLFGVFWRSKSDWAAHGEATPWTLLETLFAAGLAVSFLMDGIESLAPAADADTLAYHFDMPRSFLQSGAIVFEPRALDGAVPLLVQVAYMPVLALGGEAALNAWAMLSGWAVIALAYVIAVRFVDRKWALGLALVLATTPAVVYGAGSGQVEVRNAAFVLLAAAAMVRLGETGLLRFALLAGIAAGLFAGGKYLGLFFVAAAGLAVLSRRDFAGRAAAFGTGALVAGFQWYWWNWTNTGDPVFPMLYGVLDYANGQVWDQAHEDLIRRSFFSQEIFIPQHPLSFFAFPVLATLMPGPQLDSGRTGLGVIALLLAPFAVAGIWQARRTILRSRLFPVLVCVAVFYALWFFIGSSQKIRHLLPVYPLVLLLAVAATYRAVTFPAWAAALRRPAMAAVLAVCAIQMAGQALFTMNFARFVFSDESRDHFLLRNVTYFQPVPWLNAHLNETNRVLVFDRQLNFHLRVPKVFAHPVHQAEINLLSSQTSAGLLQELRKRRIDHIVIRDWEPVGAERKTGLLELTQGLVRAGCAEVRKTFDARNFASRTLPGLSARSSTIAVLRITDAGCRL
jgi:4-amino-4-deoxy-L-arabinose transferase-like glycosyltransferase